MERGHLRVIPSFPPPFIHAICRYPSAIVLYMFWMLLSFVCYGMASWCVLIESSMCLWLTVFGGVAVGTWGQSGRGVRVCNWFWRDVYRFVVMRNSLVRRGWGTLNHFGSSAFPCYPRESLVESRYWSPWYCRRSWCHMMAMAMCGAFKVFLRF